MISLNTDTDPLCFIHVLNIRSSNRSTFNNSLREGGEGREGEKNTKERGRERGKGKYMYIMHGTLKIHHFFSHTQYFQSSPSLYLILGLSTGRGLVTESLNL